MHASHVPFVRPLRLGEILDRSVRLYRLNFFTFIGIVALVQIPVSLIKFAGLLLAGSGLSQSSLFDPASAGGLLAFSTPQYAAGSALSSLGSLLGFLLVQGIVTAVLVRATADSYMGQRSTGIFAAYRRIGHAWVQMLVALVVLALLAIGAGLWWLVPCIGWITGGGMLLFLGWVILPLLAPAVVIERQPATTAWRRAWELARRRFWWLLGFAFILFLFSFLVVSAPATIIALIGQLYFVDTGTALSGTALAVQTTIQSLADLVSNLLYIPLQAICFTVVYFDLRIRTEGLDLAMRVSPDSKPDPISAPQATVQGLNSPTINSADLLSETAYPTGKTPLLRWVDVGRFSLMTLFVVGSFVLLYALLFVAILLLSTA